MVNKKRLILAIDCKNVPREADYQPLKARINHHKINFRCQSIQWEIDFLIWTTNTLCVIHGLRDNRDKFVILRFSSVLSMSKNWTNRNNADLCYS